MQLLGLLNTESPIVYSSVAMKKVTYREAGYIQLKSSINLPIKELEKLFIFIHIYYNFWCIETINYNHPLFFTIYVKPILRGTSSKNKNVKKS